MKFKNRNGTFSSFVTIDQTTGRPNYTRHNPETGEIYIPKEICNVQLTPEDKETLRKGQAVLSGKHDRTYGRGILLVCQTGHEYRKDDVFTHAGRVQRAAGATHPGGGLRSCVHGTGKGEPSRWKDHPCRRAEKQRAVLQLLPESQPLFRTVAIFPGEPDIRRDTSVVPHRRRPHRAAAGTEERRFTGGITRPKGNRTNYTNLKSPNRMNTNQNARHIYKAEDIDWNGLEAAGISKNNWKPAVTWNCCCKARKRKSSR